MRRIKLRRTERNILKRVLCIFCVLYLLITFIGCSKIETTREPIKLDRAIAAGEKTLYYLDDEGYIKILDYSSGKNTYLCNKPECKHNDKKCYAYSDTMMLFADRSNLYTVSVENFKLEKRNLDGSGKTVYFELCSKYNSHNDSVAVPVSGVYFDNKLYMTYDVSVLNADNATEEKKGVITCIDFNNKTEIELSENMNSQFLLLNFIDGKLYYFEFHSNLQQMDLSDLDNTDCSVYAMNPADNSTEKIYSAKQKEFNFSGLTDGKILYYRNLVKDKLYSITLPDGKPVDESYLKRYCDDKKRGDIVFSDERKTFMLLGKDEKLAELPFEEKYDIEFWYEAGEGLIFSCSNSDIKGENFTIEENKRFYISKDNFYGKKYIFYPVN